MFIPMLSISMPILIPVLVLISMLVLVLVPVLVLIPMTVLVPITFAGAAVTVFVLGAGLVRLVVLTAVFVFAEK